MPLKGMEGVGPSHRTMARSSAVGPLPHGGGSDRVAANRKGGGYSVTVVS